MLQIIKIKLNTIKVIRSLVKNSFMKKFGFILVSNYRVSRENTLITQFESNEEKKSLKSSMVNVLSGHTI